MNVLRRLYESLKKTFSLPLSYLCNERGNLILERARLGSMSMPASTTTTLEIEEARLLYALECHLRGRLEISGGTTSGTLVNENPQTYLSALRVISTPRTTAADRLPKDLRGKDVYALRQIYGRNSPLRTQVAVGVGSHDFEVFLPLIFPPPDAPPAIQMRSLYPSAQFSRTVVEAVSLTAASLVAGGDRTKAMQAKESATGNPEIVVTAVRVLNVDPRNYNPWVYKQRVVDFDIDISTANDAQRITTISRGPVYRSLVIKQFVNDGVAEAPSASGVDGIRLEVDRKPAFFDYMEAGASDDQGWKRAVAQGLEDRVPNNDPTGYIVFDWVTRHGRFNRVFNSRELIDAGMPLELIVDTDGTANNALDILANEVVPPVRR